MAGDQPVISTLQILETGRCPSVPRKLEGELFESRAHRVELSQIVFAYRPDEKPSVGLA